MTGMVQVSRRAVLAGIMALPAASCRAPKPGSRYAAYTKALRAPISAGEGARGLVRAATLAANGHNTQPWCFAIDTGSITVMPDFARRTPAVDPDNHHLFVSLGCAAENMQVAGRATGRGGDIDFGADGHFHYRWTATRPDTTALSAVIGQRQSTRTKFNGRPISSDMLAHIERAASMEGVRTVVVTDAASLARLRDLVTAANDVQMANPAFRHELRAWLRFSPDSAMRHGDGLFSACTGNPTFPGDWIGRRAYDLFLNPETERDRYAAQLASTPAVLLFFAERTGPQGWARVGQACQRVMLTITALGLRHSFVNQPIEEPRFRGEVATLAGERLRPDLVLRLGTAGTMSYSPRRPVTAALRN